MDISIIIPAYNEEVMLPNTLNALRCNPLPGKNEVIVVDDGSTDFTHAVAGIWADKVISLNKNHGKGFALSKGLEKAVGEKVLFLDADLGDSARNSVLLLDAMGDSAADLVLATLPLAQYGGFGLVKKWAQRQLIRRMGRKVGSPLSGQRLLNRKAVEAIANWDCGFGIEVAMLLDVFKAGLKVTEVQVPFSHRATKKDLRGFLHRGKQFIEMRKMVKHWEKECT